MDIQLGEKALRLFDQDLLDVRACFWLYHPESESWRFVVVTPLVSTMGPKEVYSRIGAVLRQHGLDASLPLSQVSAISPKDEIATLIGAAIHTDPNAIAGVHFKNNIINRVLIEDAYVYRAA